MQINGKELIISLASFDEAMDLQDAIGEALKGTSLKLPGSTKEELTDDTFGDIIGAVLGVATSKKVRSALFACAARAVYGADKAKVDRDFFEKDANRELYYPIMVEIIKANIGPFFKSLVSQFGGLGALAGSFQK